MHCSKRTIHFLTVSNGPTSILSTVSFTQRKSPETIFWSVFEKSQTLAKQKFLRRLTDVTEKKYLEIFEICSRRVFLRDFWDLKTLQKDFFLEMSLRRQKDVTKNLSLLRCFLKFFEMSLLMEILLRSGLGYMLSFFYVLTFFLRIC